MIELEMRGLGLFGAVLLRSTGAVTEVQQQRSVSTETAIAVRSTSGADGERLAHAERNPRYIVSLKAIFPSCLCRIYSTIKAWQIPCLPSGNLQNESRAMCGRREGTA